MLMKENNLNLGKAVEHRHCIQPGCFLSEERLNVANVVALIFDSSFTIKHFAIGKRCKRLNIAVF